MHPSRFLILQCLRNSIEPPFVEQISQETKINPRMVSHHLDVLEEQELVKCNYEMRQINNSKRTMAVRLCQITHKAEEVFIDIKESLEI